MVTKGYRKGVYERVTKGINGGYRWIGQTRPYIRGWRVSSTKLVCGGVQQRVTLPMRDWTTRLAAKAAVGFMVFAAWQEAASFQNVSAR
jgi:hypothetical protein